MSDLLTIGGEVFINREGKESFMGYINRVEENAVYVHSLKGESLVKRGDLQKIKTPLGKIKYIITL